MPKDKKRDASSSDSDSGPDDRAPAPKKKSKGGASGSSRVDNDGKEPTWLLENKKFVKVREFRGKVYVDIREYYEQDGEMKPSKKGISLVATQWHKLKGIINEVDDALKNF